MPKKKYILDHPSWGDETDNLEDVRELLKEKNVTLYVRADEWGKIQRELLAFKKSNAELARLNHDLAEWAAQAITTITKSLTGFPIKKGHE